jgi:hypothetical protein
MASDAELWADVGLAGVWDDASIDSDVPFTREQAGALMRAAYAQGYVDCLGEIPQPSLGVAVRRAQELRLKLPV